MHAILLLPSFSNCSWDFILLRIGCECSYVNRLGAASPDELSPVDSWVTLKLALQRIVPKHVFNQAIQIF